MKILLIGASKNIGYYSALRLLSKGHTCVFLLRNTSVFDADSDIQRHVKEGSARLIKGDALVPEDVRRLWEVTLGVGVGIDYVLFTLGGLATFKITKGYVISPPNLVSSSIVNVLKHFPSPSTSPQPRLIVLSTPGTTHSSHKLLPPLLRVAYPLLLSQPHADKLGLEKVVYHSGGWKWDGKDKVKPQILGEGWEKELPPSGWLKSAVVLQPALFTDGPCKAEVEGKIAVRAGVGLKGASQISRKDVAWWIVECLMVEFDSFANKTIGLGY